MTGKVEKVLLRCQDSIEAVEALQGNEVGVLGEKGKGERSECGFEGQRVTNLFILFLRYF